MNSRYLAILVAGAASLSACATMDDEPPPPPPPLGVGAIFGSVAADRDGDGVADGYYTSDGVYHPFVPPPCPICPPPPPPPSPSGERG